MSFVKDRVFPFFNFFSSTERVDDLLTSFPEAVEELRRRSQDQELRRAVEEYLHEDIPPHFRGEPILYLARHVATPNFETLRFLHLVEPTGFQPVIGQDVQDIFVPINPLKKSLGKLPIMLGISRKDGGYLERIENKNILDFNTANGKPFNAIQTSWGEDLSGFHASLFREVSRLPATIVDDSEWITRHGRGDLLEHYKHFLALFIVHGILFEDYLINDKHEQEFIRTVLRPAFKYIENRFHCRPLITHLTPTSVESPLYWISYPERIKHVIEEKMQESALHTAVPPRPVGKIGE